MSNKRATYGLDALCSNNMKLDMPTSIRIVCDLIRAGISEACYYRNILPVQCFREVVLNGVRGQTFACKLAVGSPKTGSNATTALGGDVINNWCKEIGRTLIAQRSSGAVSRITFGFSSVEDISVVLEEYLFDIDVRGVAPPQSQNSCQYQAMEILESLNFLVRTLDPIPGSSENGKPIPLYTFVKVYLTDAENRAPASIGSTLLTEASKEYNYGVSYYDKIAFQMKIGTLRTAHHSVTVGVCSALDSITDASKDQSLAQERVPDNLAMCSSLEIPTEGPSSMQKGTPMGKRMETPRSVRGKELPGVLKKLRASPPSSSIDYETESESHERSMMVDDVSFQDNPGKEQSAAINTTRKRRRGGRLAGLLSSPLEK